jgi:hypothetical protein
MDTESLVPEMQMLRERLASEMNGQPPRSADERAAG